jgi:streptomycin 6-kinase
MSRDFVEKLPRKFTEVILGAFREEGRYWMESLPQIIGEIEENWSLRIEKNPFPNLSYHYVAPCLCADESEAVVKIGFPGEAVYILNEVKTLKFISGRSLVKLLRFDEKRFAMLLEKLVPGENLKTVCRDNDLKAVEIAIKTMSKFWRKPPADHDFPMLEKWFDGLKEAERINFAPEYTKKALTFFEELNASADSKMLLHGDFHHENILSAEREPFLAIDPKGIVGNIGYDITVFLINHANWLVGKPDFQKKLDDAVGKFSDAFEIESSDLRKWTFAHSVLSAWWTFEENCENWKRELAFAEIWKV